MKNKEIVKGAAWIAAGGFVSKIIGALYRIPLINLIGGRGIGLYQMIYPFYCLLLTVSATGIPSSIAAITARERAKGERERGVLRPALKLFLTVGALGTALMIVLSPVLSSWQGEPSLKNGYIALAPSVVLVSAISVFRGWFQGVGNMRPTAISEVLEQLVKVTFGLFLAYLYRGNEEKTVAALTFSVTVSELFALFYILMKYKRVPAPSLFRKDGDVVEVKEILNTSAFVTLSSSALPLSNMIESTLLVRLMGEYAENAVGLYGLFAGGATTLVNLPVSLCYGIVAATIPAIAEAERGERRKKIFSSLGLTLLVSVPCAAGLYLLAPTVVDVVYRALSAIEKQTLIKLARGLAASAVTLSCLQTLSGALTALGKPKLGVISLFTGILLKLGLDCVLVSKPTYSIYGAVIATNACYALVFAINLFQNLRLTRKEGR